MIKYFIALLLCFPVFAQYTLINQTGFNGTQFFAHGTDWYYQAQKIKLDSTCTVDSIAIRMDRIGNPATGNVWLDIQTAQDTSAATRVGRSVAIPTADVPTGADTTYVFNTGIILQAGTDYYLVARHTHTPDGANYFRIYFRGTIDPYRNGEVYDYYRINSGNSWFIGTPNDWYMIVYGAAYIAPVTNKKSAYSGYGGLSKY